MTPRSLQTVLRTLVGDPPVPDAELLARFLAGDGLAFGDLVRRHGRLVWSACRHLTRSEAEADDAFQATFLVLLRNARKVRDPGKLSAWLHGAAYKVCANARKASARRAAREQAVATAEGNGHAVSAAAWDRALAAVHEAVPALPDGQRAVFVLCCLEGVPPSEAARQLGVKPGTVDSRLSRAKAAVLARLEARGLAVGAAAGLTLLSPPTSAVARAAALAHAGAVLPASLLTLSHGVVGMSVNPLKALAAGLIVACGLGGSVGGGLLSATATAQPPAAAKVTSDLEAQMQALRDKLAATEAALAQAQAQAEQNVLVGRLTSFQPAEVTLDAVNLTTFTLVEQPSVRTAKFEYLFVPVSGADQARFGEILTQHEGRGWEYAGTTPLADPKRDVWVFRRPVASGTFTLSSDAVHTAPTLGLTSSRPAAPAIVRDAARPAATKPAEKVAGKSVDVVKGTRVDPAFSAPTRSAPSADVVVTEGTLTLSRTVPDTELTVNGGTLTLTAPAATDEAARLQAEIAALQAKLAKLKPVANTRTVTVTFGKEDSVLEPATLGQLLLDLGQKKFGTGGRVTVRVTGGHVNVTGDKAVTDWAAATVKSIKGN